MREVKAADIEGLESCAFCEFCIVLPPEEKSIKCLNPECYKETCRLKYFKLFYKLLLIIIDLKVGNNIFQLFTNVVCFFWNSDQILNNRVAAIEYLTLKKNQYWVVYVDIMKKIR